MASDGVIDTEAELKAAIEKGGEVVLGGDITLTTAQSLEIASGTVVTLDLGGKTISGGGRDANSNRVHVIKNEGVLIIKNGTVSSTANNGGSALYNVAGASLTIENVEINGAPIGDGSWPSYGVNNYGNLTVNGAKINTYHGGIATGGDGVTVINDATIDVGQDTTTKQTSWALYAFEDGQVTVNDGTFKNTKNENGKVYGGGYICAGSTKPVVINGGIFDKTEGDGNGTGFYYQNQKLVIRGGTFDANPSAYANETGVSVTKESEKYIVTDSREAEIGTERYATLADAIEKAEAGQTVTLLQDVEIADTVAVTIDKAITLDGNNHKLTATNNTSNGRAINVGKKGSPVNGVTIKNLTINASGERAINVIQGATNVTIDNVTATAANYTVNVASTAPNAVVTITNSDLTGLNVVNIAATDANVTVTNTKLTCNDQNAN